MWVPAWNEDRVTENRESFFTRLEPFLAPSSLLDVQLAYTLAKYGHRSQVRKELNADGEPIRYFEHVRRVAIILIDEVKIVEPDLVIAALLHDGPEDTRDLTPAMIERCFGTQVAHTVKVLSKTPPEGYLDRFKVCTDWRPYIIKGCDRLDNVRSLKAGTADFLAKQVRETRGKYYPLFDRMLQLIPDVYKDRAQVLRDLVVTTTERVGAAVDT